MNSLPLIIFYDAQCNLCRTGHDVLSEYDAGFQFVDIHDPQIVQKYPQVRGLPLGCQMHALDDTGEMTGGYDTLVVIAERLSSMQPFVPLMKWKPVRAIGWSLYRLIAKNRFAIFGGSESAQVCKIAI